jgi:hypothetical protein
VGRTKQAIGCCSTTTTRSHATMAGYTSTSTTTQPPRWGRGQLFISFISTIYWRVYADDAPVSCHDRWHGLVSLVVVNGHKRIDSCKIGLNWEGNRTRSLQETSQSSLSRLSKPKLTRLTPSHPHPQPSSHHTTLSSPRKQPGSNLPTPPPFPPNAQNNLDPHLLALLTRNSPRHRRERTPLGPRRLFVPGPPRRNGRMGIRTPQDQAQRSRIARERPVHERCYGTGT